jgi:hypothetical protein
VRRLAAAFKGGYKTTQVMLSEAKHLNVNSTAISANTGPGVSI